MQTINRFLRISLFLILCSEGVIAMHAQEEILYEFGGGSDGGTPQNGLITDNLGNLYGTAAFGGNSGVGVVFRLTPEQNGWNYSVLYSFQNSGSDGQSPNSTLIFDALGNLYGTTLAGGAFGYGTAFQLSPSPGGDWTETALYSFGGQEADGTVPVAGLVIDSAGDLYGVTATGGSVASPCPSFGCGTAFQLSPGIGGQWTETVLWRFQGGNDGENPRGGLLLGQNGDLFGTTFAGGGSGCKENPLLGCGTVFELSSTPAGWSESVLYAFKGRRDGAGPIGSLLMDGPGNLYGTTLGGGVFGLGACDGSGVGGCGVVFRLSPALGSWTGSILHSFRGLQNGSKDGSHPWAGLTMDSSGRLYGTTISGGCCSSIGFGSIFRLTPGPNDKWKKEQFAFRSASRGESPMGGVTLDATDNVYGTTSAGGAGFGVVFEIIPPN